MAQSSLKDRIKRVLVELHLFDAALKVREKARSLKYLKRNLPFFFSKVRLDIAIPPLSLINQVTGVPDIKWFLDGGNLSVESLNLALGRNDLNLQMFRAILDFGCGCGRTIRHLRSLTDAEIYGSDYSDKLITWCEREIPFASFETNSTEPPLSFSNEMFDLVYALSVLTHLPENLGISWMKEFRRVLKPGGYLLISTHGEWYLNMLSDAEICHFKSGKLVIKDHEVIGGNKFGVYHPPEYVREKLATGFEIVDFIPEGAKGNPHQDIYLFRKPV